MMIPSSTLRSIHRIMGEETPPAGGLREIVMRLTSLVDGEIWLRSADIALVGGDPVILARRLRTLSMADATARVAVLHPGQFSGAPLALLGDDSFRCSLGATARSSCSAREWMMSEIERCLDGVLNRAVPGILAAEAVRGLHDAQRGETVLQLTRSAKRARRAGVAPSLPLPAFARPADVAPAPVKTLYRRSEQLHRLGLERIFTRLAPSWSMPPARPRFADIVIVPRVEILSGAISPPADPEAMLPQVSMTCKLARQVPSSVENAITFWRDDLAWAAAAPIWKTGPE